LDAERHALLTEASSVLTRVRPDTEAGQALRAMARMTRILVTDDTRIPADVLDQPLCGLDCDPDQAGAVGIPAALCSRLWTYLVNRHSTPGT